MTIAETALWALLRSRRLEGLKFRRQVPVGPYIADFACLECRLIVEADGEVHALRDPERELRRSAWLDDARFRVVRFQNETVIDRPHEVIDTILRLTGQGRRDPSSGPSDHLLPQGEKAAQESTDIYGESTVKSHLKCNHPAPANHR